MYHSRTPRRPYLDGDGVRGEQGILRAQMKPLCAHCLKPVTQSASALGRAEREGRRVFCDRRCMGLARRVEKSKAQKVEEKRLYDEAYRQKNLAALKAKKAAYFQRTYDPAKAAVERKGRMAQHVEYCRRPEYKAWKAEYDRAYRAKADFGPFWEAALLLLQVDEEVASRMSRYEIYSANGTLNKSLRRKREYESSVGYRP